MATSCPGRRARSHTSPPSMTMRKCQSTIPRIWITTHNALRPCSPALPSGSLTKRGHSPSAGPVSAPADFLLVRTTGRAPWALQILSNNAFSRTPTSRDCSCRESPPASAPFARLPLLTAFSTAAATNSFRLFDCSLLEAAVESRPPEPKAPGPALPFNKP